MNTTTYLAAEVGEGGALVGKGGVIHDVPVKHIELIVGHSILRKEEREWFKIQTHTQKCFFEFLTFNLLGCI